MIDATPDASGPFTIGTGPVKLETVMAFVFGRQGARGPVLTEDCETRIRLSHERLRQLIDDGTPIYGVTTGFGDSGFRMVAAERSAELQRNLVAYLLCGTGAHLSRDASRATLVARLLSLSRGYSGVSIELVHRLRLLLERDWLPVIPREGSLGASGDLVPLAYLADAIQGNGDVYDPSTNLDETLPLPGLLAAEGLQGYVLKPKEGLALVNGTSAMVGVSLVNVRHAQFLSQLACLTTSWACIALQGRPEAFEPLVNELASGHRGQALVARTIRTLLAEEEYAPAPVRHAVQSDRNGFLQDRYSVRCAPQVLGPVAETIEHAARWLETELNGASDNPIVDPGATPGQSLAMGGNFYGGYLAQAMDQLKIGLAQIADLMDRQLMYLMDERANRGLHANLAAWDDIPEADRHLHHGLKGLHQSVSAITSEIMAKATPASIFSRSSESHNQDKVSLGMAAATQCQDLTDQLFTVAAMHLVCLAQALELRRIHLKGTTSMAMFDLVRQHVDFVTRDRALGLPVRNLASSLRRLATIHGDRLPRGL